MLGNSFLGPIEYRHSTVGHILHIPSAVEQALQTILRIDGAPRFPALDYRHR